MNQVTQVKSDLRKARWKQLIQECQSSGMTVRDWCKQNNIKEQTYYRNLMNHSLASPSSVANQMKYVIMFSGHIMKVNIIMQFI